MTTARLTTLIIVVLLMSTGQILFKLAASRLGNLELSWDAIWRLILNPYLVAAIIIYGVTTILWVLVLVNGDLSHSYPFMALTMVLVPLAGVLIFGETLSISLAVGGTLILAGLAVIAFG